MPADSRPNIVLITTDQQRGDCLGIDGHPVLQTPNMDYLATLGTRFRRAYSECPACIPARRSLMTGMAPAAHGMIGMVDSDWSPPFTLAGELTKAGYQTEMIGKLHLQPYGKRFGFEHMVLADDPAREDNAYTRWLRQHHGRFEPERGVSHGVSLNSWVGRPSHLPEEQHFSYWAVTEAIEFLQHRDPTAPFFLNVSLFDPHPPLTPPTLYYDRYIHGELPEPIVGDWAKDAFDGPTRGLSPNAWRMCLDRQQMRQCQAGYFGLINFVDDQIGRLLSAMGKCKALTNTWVILTSDHGEMLGDHHIFRKTWAYEGSARVPLVIKPAGTSKLPVGLVSSAPVGLQDVMPTLLEVAGVPIPAACTGRSLLPAVRDVSASVRDVLHGEYGQRVTTAGPRPVPSSVRDALQANAMHFLVDSRYKYIWYSQHGTEQLFDLVEDPNETRDLSRLPQMQECLKTWRQRLVQLLKDRPEGFSNGRELIVGRPHEKMIPDYQPDRFYPYL